LKGEDRMSKLGACVSYIVGSCVFGVGILAFVEGNVVMGIVNTCIAGINFFIAHWNMQDD